MVWYSIARWMLLLLMPVCGGILQKKEDGNRGEWLLQKRGLEIFLLLCATYDAMPSHIDPAICVLLLL